jgi:hypothetical protein
MIKNKDLRRLYFALLQYNICLLFPFLKTIFDCETGLCRHFGLKMPMALSELEPNPSPLYWFPRGYLKPRIKLIKQAITNINKNYENKSN